MSYSKRKIIKTVTGTALAVSAALAATTSSALADSTTLIGSIRIGAVYNDNAGNDGEFNFTNFGSRLILKGDRDLGNGLKGIGYLEFGINPDNNSRGSSGVDRTRHLWGGVEGGFGSLKIGAQYAAFYDLVSGHTDIAWWGSCWTQFECGRETQVLKYSGSFGGLTIGASVEAYGDADEDIADELELGFNYALGGFTVGLAASIHSDETDDAGVNDEGGVLIGGVVSGALGPVNLAVTLQAADEDFTNGDDATNVTIGASAGNAYLVANAGDSGDFATLGYTHNIGPASLMYFEAQTVEAADDDDIILRATYKVDI